MQSIGRSALAVMSSLVMTATVSAQVTVTSGTPRALAADVVFSDEFDAPAGTPVDTSKWYFDTGDNPSNAERQYYTDSTRNAVHDGNGNLVITARKENPADYRCWYGRCEYTSARLTTAGKFRTTYGRFEARIKIPRGQGIWPAFWLLGDNFGQVGWPDCGEIDIMENIGREPSTVHGTIHGPGYSGGGGIGAAYTLPNGQQFADDFHVFAVEWSPNRIAWSVDGHVYQVRTPADLGGRRWVFDHDFFLILNVAVGGHWPGDPDGSTQFPQRMLVDYVRVTA
jgi:beta-glucanase (GH16 family)